MSEDEAIPESVETWNNTGPLQGIGNGSARFSMILRTTFAVVLTVLLVGNVALYSLHQTLNARVESQEHRIQRLNKMLTDMLTANQNAEKIEKIKQQVSGIEGQMDDLTTTIKAQNAVEAKKSAEEKKPPKRRR